MSYQSNVIIPKVFPENVGYIKGHSFKFKEVHLLRKGPTALAPNKIMGH